MSRPAAAALDGKKHFAFKMRKAQKNNFYKNVINNKKFADKSQLLCQVGQTRYSKITEVKQSWAWDEGNDEVLLVAQNEWLK